MLFRSQALTPRSTPVCRWLAPSSRRRLRICCPKLRGAFSASFGINALSVIGRNGKRATRPCSCGYLGHHNGRCHCTPDQIARYRARISGPLLDRIDIQVEVPAVPAEDLSRARTSESSIVVRERVERARAKMVARQGKENARLTTREIDQHCAPDDKGASLLKQSISLLGLSARGYHRILKVARTIADLAGMERVSDPQVAEAIQYRK